MGRKANVMRSLKLVLLILVIFSILISGCLQENYGAQKNYSVQENHSSQRTYKTLSESQIDQFLAGKNVTPLAIRTIENSTVVLYETKLEMGIYRLSIDENDKMSLTQISWQNNSAFTPVSIGGTATGIPFVTVIINDEQILKKAYKAIVVFVNKDEVTELVNNNKGIIIPDENIRNANVGWSSVTILDEDDKVIFKKA
ncbi:MAG: hypothetical protein OIN66_10640 [Candidatus Methanoperedens sp.]|nr:hypothetical protein [Candidatus Methanoperedens sp.]